MNLGEIFSVDSVEASNNYEPLPAGWYSASISDAELRDTKAGTGVYVSVKYVISGPSHQGRIVYGNMNIRNPNPMAEDIGRQQLAALMRAIGLEEIRDTDQLIGGNCEIKLSIKQDEQYGDRNEIKAWKALEKAQKAQEPAAKKSAAPWSKK